MRSSLVLATLEKAILQGTTHMRTHLEVDPGVGLRSLEGVLPLVRDYAWAVDLQILHFPPGRPAQQPRHGRTDGQGPQARLRGGRRRALHRFRSAWPDRSRLRDGEGVRCRHRYAP